MFGFLNVNKPAGKSSRDIVNVVQRIVRPNKTGHGGTLDPLATGVLVVAVGPATRLIEYVQAQPKTYVGSFRLGVESETDDLEGNVVPFSDAQQPSLTEIEAALPSFVGDIQQVPPAYSAIKIKGQRAYELARRGDEVQLKPRTVQIYELVVNEFSYPDLTLTIRCGSGTYIRSLGRDLAMALGTRAVMTSLERTAIGGFRIDESCDPSQLKQENMAQFCVPPEVGLASHARVTVDAQELRLLQNGRPVPEISGVTESDALPLAFDDEGRLQAMLRWTEQGWRVAKSFWDAHGTPPKKIAASPSDPS